MKEVRSSERFQVPKSMPGDLAELLSLLIHLHKQKVTIERLPSSNLKKYLIGKIDELLATTSAQNEQCELPVPPQYLETIERLQIEVRRLQTDLASAEDQLAKATDKPPTQIFGFRLRSLILALIIGYILAWLEFG